VISFLGNTFSGQLTQQNYTASEPPGVSKGDVMFGLSVVGIASASLTRPTGWTQIFGIVGTNFRADWSWIRRTASAPTLQWTTSTSAYIEVHVGAYRGVIPFGLPYEHAVSGPIIATAATIDCPAVNPKSPFCVILGAGVNWAGAASGGWAPPANYSLSSDNTVGNDIATIRRSFDAVIPASEDPGTITNAGSSTENWAATLVLQPDIIGLSNAVRSNRNRKIFLMKAGLI
jgi:hypothetical protein